MKPELKMTPAEIQKEWEYRMQERLAIAAGAGKPRPEHFTQAKREADEWKAANDQGQRRRAADSQNDTAA